MNKTFTTDQMLPGSKADVAELRFPAHMAATLDAVVRRVIAENERRIERFTNKQDRRCRRLQLETADLYRIATGTREIRDRWADELLADLTPAEAVS